jgi:hypothetical protein
VALTAGPPTRCRRADDLARAITTLAEDHSELQRLRRAAHATAVERFGPQP